jgi:hypothetical protein
MRRHFRVNAEVLRHRPGPRGRGAVRAPGGLAVYGLGRRTAAAPLIGTGPFVLEVLGPPAPLYVLLVFLLVPNISPVLCLVLTFVRFLVPRRGWLPWGAAFFTSPWSTWPGTGRRHAPKIPWNRR